MKLTTDQNFQSEFTTTWQKRFGGFPPLGYELRFAFSNNWTRFHALPASKRYATTSDERDIILLRANTLLQECFGNAKIVWLIAERYDTSDLASSDITSKLDMEHVFSWNDETEEPEYRQSREFYAVKINRNAMAFDQYFASAATDECRFLLFDPLNHTVLAPYDGGFDVFSFQKSIITLLETKYKHWMSKRPDKL